MDSIELLNKMIDETIQSIDDAKARLIRRLNYADDYSLVTICDDEWNDFKRCLEQKALLETIRDRMYYEPEF